MLQSRMIQLVQTKSLLRIQPVRFLKSLSHGLSRESMYDRGRRARPRVTMPPTSLHTSYSCSSKCLQNLTNLSTVIQINPDESTVGVTVKKIPVDGPSIDVEVDTFIVFIIVLFGFVWLELIYDDDQGVPAQQKTNWTNLMNGFVFNAFVNHGVDKEHILKQIQKKQGTCSSMESAIDFGQSLIRRFQETHGFPGLSIAVSVDGETVWKEGFGYEDAGNKNPYKSTTMFSIYGHLTRSLLMVAVAKLWEEGKLDLDKPVQHYVPEFPEKKWYGRKVDITTRHLVRDMGGIRGYNNMPPGKNNEQVFAASPLDSFKDDPLFVKPGTYKFSDYGWTLVIAIIEKVTQLPLEEYLRKIFDDMDLKNTQFAGAEHVAKSGRFYTQRNENNSNIHMDDIWMSPSKGLISNAVDLVKFGNAMLYSYQTCSCPTRRCSSKPPACLKGKTVGMIWQMMKDCVTYHSCEKHIGDTFRGMGWFIHPITARPLADHFPSMSLSSSCQKGSQSVLLIIPAPKGHRPMKERLKHPRGIVVCMHGNFDNPKFEIKKVIIDLTSIFLSAYMIGSCKTR